MKLKTLTIKIEKKLAWITINRPKKLNALNSQTLTELHHALVVLEEDNKVRLVVLTGAGDTAFVAGADIRELADLTPKAVLRLHSREIRKSLIILSIITNQ